jgi:MFS superfamily sulfate permease-like transporter
MDIMKFFNLPPVSAVDIKKDLVSGFFVFLIALPLCLGIAMASGFPPVAGIMTAVIGGLFSTFLGSSPLTIKGPAAGLIVIALGAVQELGGGDPLVGYRRALAVGVIAALLQLAFALLRAATLGVTMSPSVVHGMLAAIGVIIVSKQAHTMLGVSPQGKGPLELLAEIPHSLATSNPEIALIGIFSLAILFLWPLIKKPWAKRVPAPILVLLTAIPLGMLFNLDQSHTYSLSGHNYHIGPDYLVQLPGNVLNAVTFPDFSVIFSAVSIKYVIMFALVGIIESTLSVLAVDALDPKKRASNLNRDLVAVSLGNLVSSLVGGLPMISEIVRSKANIDAEAKTGWSNFFHGLCLLLFVALAPGLLHRIPLAALAAMLVYTGARLASPSELQHAKSIGYDQLAFFTVTLLTTLATDLLVGVATGIVLKICLHAFRGAGLKALFKPTVLVRVSDNEAELEVLGAAVFTTILKVRTACSALPEQVDRVTINLENAILVDHTFIKNLKAMGDEWPHTQLEFWGLEDMVPTSEHPLASRRRVA